ncbi:chorismate lyase [Halomonas vilamensis]|uniref:Probable chorismate pyruvate-lyase n=1 Tax=Vreelandella vilamensis TaxID=531309 RepID=A0ABU1H6D3_9GAMM|nr:chorismate lyase [Halomonas vilamensis]MDR5899421.1 chorismate lyase [Halomonas vilamensis]
MQTQSCAPIARWLPVTAARPAMSLPWWRWVASTDSLTARLIAAGEGRKFRVRLLRQSIGFAFADEAMALGIGQRRYAWRREVALCLDGTPWVVARTVAPLAQCRGQRLEQLGERSLGSWLFQQPDLKRGPLEVTSQPPRFAAVDSCWGRRSRFQHAGLSLLVQEYFLTAMADALALPSR